MKLQILVPQYKETDDVIKPLLDSIAIQQNVPMNEIGVIICNDGSDVFLSEDFLNSYPFKVEYHKEPHRGVSGTRNACLDYAKADYVMFCDVNPLKWYPIEQWKEIEEYNGLYKISTYGRVYSYPRFRTKGGFVKPSSSTSGYPITHLSSNGVVKTLQIHRLVAKHFIENVNNYPEVNHIDECKTNNYVWNLEFCTRKYNQNYGTAISRAVKSHDYAASSLKSAKNHDYKIMSMKTSKPLLQYDLLGNVIKRWSGLRAACKELNISCGNVSKACKENTVAYGFKWAYEG